jgi:amino acid adenylation domain-containing protein
MQGDEGRSTLPVGWVEGPRLAPPVADLATILQPALASAPDAEALVVRRDDGTTVRWTYRDLDAEVARRAADLRAAGVRPGDAVLLVAARTPGLVPALLAVLRLGATYVPVDPAAPDARWRDVAAAVRAAALLGPAAAVNRARTLLDPPTVLVDVEAPAGGTAEPVPAAPVDASTPAYVLFTSGSTGTPKGVVVSHANVTHRLVSYLALTDGPCRYLLHSSMCFDGAVGGMFSTLARGGCLVLVPDAVAGDPGLVAHAVRDERITHLEPVPSWYAALLDVADPGALYSVRVVILGGEVLPVDLIATSHRLLPAARVFNDYGPTEVTVAATVHEVVPGPPGPDVPIGRPHANTEVAVLDEELRPVGVGEVGELWVGGPCVAHGYLGRPDHPSFVTDEETGGRRYRTGDLVRWGPDGLLHYSGRRDRQVKIRGQRVEPEEVEAVLLGLAGVAEAAVEVDSAGGDPRLVAYVSASAGVELTADEVGRRLAERLPLYLRPSATVVLPRLPLTPGGKVDRAALPAVAWDSGTTDPAAEPRGGAERLVADAFQAVLGTSVDRDTDFFAAGGQSLGAARVVARLRAETGVQVAVADLGAHRTPAGLAAVLADRPQAADGAPLVRRARPADTPWRVAASPRQESFWYLEHVPGGRGRSNLVELLTFPRGTQHDLLRRAVEVLVERHAALRTGFELAADGLWQVVQPSAVPSVVRLPDVADAGALERLADDLGAEPFDLTRAPLLRAASTEGPDGPVVVLVVHHAVADGWSLNLLVEELVAIVRADGSDAELPRPDVEFVDHAEWIAERTAARRHAAVEHLTPLARRSAETAERVLPYDRPPHARAVLRADLVRGRVPADTFARVQELAGRLGTTTYTVLAAALGALLAQTSGQESVVLSGPLSGRGEPALDRVVGCCINTRLTPVDVAGDPAFAELVRRVAEAADAGEPHEWLPLEEVVRQLEEGIRAQVGSVLFNLLEPGGPLAVTGGTVTRHGRPSAMAYSELDLYLEHRDGGLTVEAVHSSRLDGSTVRRLLDRWLGLLEAALEEPDRPVGALPLTTADEDALLLSFEGDPGPPVPGTVPDEVRARTAEDRDAVAVVDASGTWTRGQLWDRAGAIAGLLAGRGLRPGDAVVLALDETADAVAALLACWRSGAVPVPVGEGQPAARTEAVAAAAGAAVVLDRTALASAGRSAPWDDVPTDAAAYVLFTSGSTGRPKGVVVGHPALMASTQARVAAYPDRPDVALVAHDMSFDAALGIVAWYLATGGVLVMATREERLDPSLLTGLIGRHGVGQLDIVPSHYRLLLELASPSELASLRLVTLGAEACPPGLVAEHLAALPHAALVNEYGPTESTVWALAHTATAADATADRVPVGTPIRGVTARICNPAGQRVAAGIEGELLLGGHLLADGYLGDPGSTAERFVELDGRRWYRTGDRARWTAGGNVEFLGRVDTQLKVRGYRIEPVEVETALARFDGVLRAAVDAREVTPGEASLVAWVQFAHDADGDEAATTRLRDRLLEDLPEWLVPTLVVPVDEIPETTSGKVDRARLALPAGGTALVGAAPETPTERLVAEVWQELLGRPVPVDQSFFALGGQSLLAARMVAALRTRFSTDLELREVLAAPRIRDISALLDAAPRREDTTPDLPQQRSRPLGLAEVEDLASRVDDLDDDEVEELLARLETT